MIIRSYTDNDYRIFTSADEDTGKMVYRVQAKPRQPIKVTKVVAYHTSRGVPSRELVDRCRRTLDRVYEARRRTGTSRRSENGWTGSGSGRM